MITINRFLSLNKRQERKCQWNNVPFVSSTMCSVPGEMKKVFHSFLSLVTSLISLVIFTSLPATGGTRRKSKILLQIREFLQFAISNYMDSKNAFVQSHRTLYLFHSMAHILAPGKAVQSTALKTQTYSGACVHLYSVISYHCLTMNTDLSIY